VREEARVCSSCWSSSEAFDDSRWARPRITAIRTGTLVWFSDHPGHGRFDDCRSYWLGSKPFVAGCRAGLGLMSTFPGGLGLPRSLPLQRAGRPFRRRPISSRSSVRIDWTAGALRLRQCQACGRSIRDFLSWGLVPFSACRSCCVIRGGQPSDHPASTFGVSNARGPPEVGAVASAKLWRPCGFVALCSPCAGPTPSVLLEFHGSHRPGAGDCATVSLSRGVPLPAWPDPATTGPDRALVRRDPATLMGFIVPFAVFPGGGSPHFCGSSPHAVSRFAPLHLWYPLIFTGTGRAFELLPQEAGGCSKMRPAFATFAWCRPASGSCCRGQAERAHLVRARHRSGALAMDAPVCVALCARQSCHGLFGSSLGRVGCRFTGTYVGPCSSSNTGTPQIAAAVPFAGLPSARGFSGELLQDVRSGSRLFEYRATEATSLPSPALQRVRAICA